VLVAGIDEAGRGPLAGPVFAAAVVLPPAGLPRRIARSIDDSKRLAPEVREALEPEILARCAVGIGRAEVAEIDRVNILQATFVAMGRALAALPQTPAHALVDGNRLPPAPSWICGCRGRAVVGGDGISLSIAAASIIAKVARDRLMAAFAEIHPGYGWETNFGYATPFHLDALRRLGPSPLHRRSFAPVSEQLCLNL
jgi:ribonuclease HII